MTNRFLKQYLRGHDLSISFGTFGFGILYGCPVTIFDDGRICIQTGIDNGLFVVQSALALHSGEIDGQAVKEVTADGTAVVIHVGGSLRGEKKVANYVAQVCDAILPDLADQVQPVPCPVCGLPADDDCIARLSGSCVVYLHEGCLEKQTLENYEAAMADSNVFGGIVGAVGGMLLGALVWGFVMNLGIFAAPFALLTAILTVQGYDKLKGRPGALRTVVVIVCVVLSVFLGTAGCYAWQLHEIWVESYKDLIAEKVFFAGAIPDLFRDSEFKIMMVKDVGLGLLFAALGSARFIVRARRDIDKVKADR
ncbi:MAG: hypothetical protein ACOYI7_09795 [Candidatus Excrementavichristensenella sp.]|jgi:hypothetical protein